MEMSSGTSSYIFPAEWEPHESVWLSWPRDDLLEMIAGRPFAPVLLDVMAALLPHVKVSVIINHANEEHAIRDFLQQRHPQLSSSSHYDLVFHIVLHQSIWMRDFGPIFVKQQKIYGGERGRTLLQVASFHWTHWGYVGDHLEPPLTLTDECVQADGGVALRAAQALSLQPASTSSFSLTSEGGDREFNGRGTLMVTEAVHLQRNPGLTRDKITQQLCAAFPCVRKVIWLKRGLAEDDQIFAGPLSNGDEGGVVFTMPCTGGHVDEYARFVGPNTILLAHVREEDRNHPIGRLSHARMEENYNILANETDQDGKPFTIIRMPLPPIDIVQVKPTDPLYADYEGTLFGNDRKSFDQARGRDGEDKSVKAVVPASYCNFLVSNGVVLMPRYYAEGRSDAVRQSDEAARAVLQSAFPTHKIVQIDCENVNFGGGGIHCITQQQPRLE